MAPVDRSYYDALGASPDATPAELRKAFRLKALQLHPDRNAHDRDGATAAFQHLNAVYNILSDADRRAHYDQFGPAQNPHADDDDAPLHASALADFLRRAASRLSSDDISAYERTYREGDDEREDLVAHYQRFEGDVHNVLMYIPYSTHADLSRFVAFWDAQIDAEQLPRTPQYAAARCALLADASKYELKQRAAKGGANDGAQAPKRANKRAKRAANKEQRDMHALAALMQKRAQRAKGQFDEWCHRIEQQADGDADKPRARSSRSSRSPRPSRPSRPSNKARGAARRAAAATTAAPSASGGVRKQRKSSR